MFAPRPISPHTGAALLVLAFVAVTVGCGGTDETEERPALDLPAYSEDGLRMVYSDIDDDGRPDVIKYFQETEDPETGEHTRTLVKTELDLTGDGRINMRRTYDETGDLSLEEMDGDLDGRMDHTVYWENGVILRTETDTDHDGYLDEFREYRDGYLSLVRRDSDHDGEVDTWSYYDQEGLARVGVDTDGDGEADRWSRRSE